MSKDKGVTWTTVPLKNDGLYQVPVNGYLWGTGKDDASKWPIAMISSTDKRSTIGEPVLCTFYELYR